MILCPVCNKQFTAINPSNNEEYVFYRCSGDTKDFESYHYFRCDDRTAKGNYIKASESFYTENFRVVIDHLRNRINIAGLKNTETDLFKIRDKKIFDAMSSYDASYEDRIKNFMLLK